MHSVSDQAAGRKGPDRVNESRGWSAAGSRAAWISLCPCAKDGLRPRWSLSCEISSCQA